MRTDRIARRDRPALHLLICTGPLERAQGLLFRPELPSGTALWLAPCRAVHTFGMRHAIDVAFVDARGLVLRVVADCPPRRMLHESRASSVLELRAGECESIALRAGERLALPRPAENVASPRSILRLAIDAEPSRARGLLALGLLVIAIAVMAGCSASPRGTAGEPARAAAPR